MENNSTQLASINKSLQNTGTSSIPSKEKCVNEMADVIVLKCLMDPHNFISLNSKTL